MFHHIMVPSCIISCHIMSLCLTWYMIHITYHIITLQFIMYHLLLIIHHAPYITYYVSFIMDQFAFNHYNFFQLPSFCSARSYQLVHHIYHVTYLPELCCIISCHMSHHVHFLCLGLVFQSVHQVFDVLFYMDAEGQSYDLRQTPLKATNKNPTGQFGWKPTILPFSIRNPMGIWVSPLFWAHGNVVICPTFGKIDGMENTVFNLPETNSIFAPENWWSWNTSYVSLWDGWPIFRCKLAVSFREGI